MDQIHPLEVKIDKIINNNDPDDSKIELKTIIDAISLSYTVNAAIYFTIFMNILLIINRLVFKSQFISLSPLSFMQTIPTQTIYPERDMISPFNDKIDFNDTELEIAIKKLNLPTWSRAYVHCSDRKSEIKCGQIIKAYRKILEWEEIVQKSPKDDSSPLLVHTYTKNGGIGNRLMQECVASILGLMLGRAVSVDASVPAGSQRRRSKHPYTYPPAGTVRYSNLGLGKCGERTPHIDLSNYLPFEFNETDIAGAHLVFKSTTLSSLIYQNQKVSLFAQEFFGMFAQYFIMNYISNIPEKYLQTIQELFKNVPANVRLFGVHLRFQWAGQFYSWNISNTMSKVVPFISSILKEKPTQIALASDNQDMMNEFGKHFDYVHTDAMRAADMDHNSGFADIIMLMYCDECLLTYRSTFSSLVSLRTGKRPYLVEKEANKIFLAYNSQCGIQSLIYHTKYWRVYMSNYYCRLVNNVDAMKYFFRYMAL